MANNRAAKSGFAAEAQRKLSMDIEFVSSSFMWEDLRLNSYIVPAYESGSGTIPDFDPDLAPNLALKIRLGSRFFIPIPLTVIIRTKPE
ncbi:hypothetical protein EVAR_28054_1 [Eumeta japonica]|uniref:Uncharacterized protein n=1 Tax=Eumeta variegata TaxID=151549 RepID=A0A4C1W8K8_EUMVA|nr:hypothetical protein EVAR_28054_1 [Eumeta japonica]